MTVVVVVAVAGACMIMQVSAHDSGCTRNSECAHLIMAIVRYAFRVKEIAQGKANSSVGGQGFGSGSVSGSELG